MIVRDIAQYEENDSELAKYTIMLLQDRIDKAIEEIRILESNCDISDYQAQKLYQILKGEIK